MSVEPVAKPVALVTGASYGIGAATALALAKAGYVLAVADLDRNMLESTLTALGNETEARLGLSLDVRRQDSIETVFQSVIAEFGRLDILVNNAGVPLRKDALEVTRDEWRHVMSVNLEGSFFMSQAMGRYLIESKRQGAIVSVSSTHGLVGLAGSSTYGVTKAGVSHMTKMLAIEWAPYGIRVNAIAPASTVTPTRKNLSDPEKRQAFISRIPLGRLGTVEDMASAIVYLAGPQASFITGQTLVVDGGLTAA